MQNEPFVIERTFDAPVKKVWDAITNKDQMKEFHKGIKEVVTAEERFRARLRTLRHDIDTDPQTKTESRDYMFVLQDAEDALKTSLEMAQDYAKEKDEEKPAGKQK